jgi:outer membrane lipoprotein carrier protein
MRRLSADWRALLAWLAALPFLTGSLLVLCLCYPSFLIAGEPAGRTQFETFMQSTPSAQGQFRQEIRERDGRLLETSEGSFAFERPGRFRWEVRAPIRQLLVADGSLLHFHDLDLAQVTERRLDQAISSTPAAVLFGNASLDRDFEVRDGEQASGLAWFEARPRAADSGIELLRIGMHGGLPEIMDVVDAFGRTSRFTLFAVRRNPALDPALFRFTAPPGTDVIRQ